MKIKSYFACSVEDAIASARQELGGEALLMSSRRSPAEARHLGDYEVVFAVDPDGPPKSESAPAPVAGATDRLSVEVANLKKELEGMRRALTRTAMTPAQWLGTPPDLSDAYALLTQNDIPADLARDIAQAVNARIERTRAPFQQALFEEIESRFRMDPGLGRGSTLPRVTALIGPPGSGKTTTIVKLAVQYGLTARRPVLLLSTDTYRIAAAEQLRSYAAILGVSFQVVETVATLAQTIEEHRGKELILIDTAGLSLREMDHAAPLARFLSTRSDIDTQLVLAASMKPSDLTRIAEAYEIFAPQRLLFSRLDETGSIGAVLSEAVRARKPLSFFTTGQTIPEDMEPAGHQRIVDMLLNTQSAAPVLRTAAA